MSIPRVIHYCWFGRGEKSELMQRCISSWKEHCPDYEIIEWNEDNFDVNFCPYAAKAYAEHRWGFMTDAARLMIIYQNGGIYLDTDVELIRPLDDLLDCEAWFAYGTGTEINTGSGFGGGAGNPFIKKLLDQYLELPGSAKYDFCTAIDTRVFREYYPDFAADHDVRQEYEGIVIINNIWSYAIHHYMNTWMSKRQKLVSRSRVLSWLRKLLIRLKILKRA